MSDEEIITSYLKRDEKAITATKDNRLSEEYCDQRGTPTDIRANWLIDGVPNRFLGGGAYINKGLVFIYNFGYILKDDEKVKIEVNGRIYE